MAITASWVLSPSSAIKRIPKVVRKTLQSIGDLSYQVDLLLSILDGFAKIQNSMAK
jgi:hypothetical protein